MVLKRAEEAAGDGAKNADPPAELLIVEDEPDGSGLYQRMLETAGYESNINDSLTEALDVVDGDYSVVLLDRRLPDRTGPELLAEMRDRELDVVVRELTNEHEMRAFHVPLISVFRDTAQAVRSSDVSFHASEFETSMMLELFPELVQMDRAEAVDVPDDALPLTEYDALGDNRVGWALSANRMDELTPTGNLGDPTVATREKGRKLVDEVVDNVTGLVDALAGMDAPGSGSSE